MAGGSGSDPPPVGDNPSGFVPGWLVGGSCVAGDLAAAQSACAGISGVSSEGSLSCYDPSLAGAYNGQLVVTYNLNIWSGSGQRVTYGNSMLLQPCDAGSDAELRAAQVADVAAAWALGFAALAMIWAIKSFVFKLIANN